MKKAPNQKNNTVISDLEVPNTYLEDDEAAASLVEYALLVALIAIVCILAVTFLGQTTSNAISDPDLIGALS